MGSFKALFYEEYLSGEMMGIVGITGEHSGEWLKADGACVEYKFFAKSKFTQSKMILDVQNK